MRAISVLPFVLAAACGSVHDRSECSASADCPVGSYCARTGDGNVCWPDAVAPAVSGVSVACDHAPCLRSGVLHVEATIADDAELLGADVSLSLGGPAVPMARSGTLWSADVPLARYPFDAFEAEVVATVTARDGARNTASAGASPIAVTRLAWEKELEAGIALTPPAVMDDGTVAVAGANHKLYLLPWDGDGVASLAVGTLQITAAPLALGTSMWVGSEDNKVYEVKKNVGGAWESNLRCDANKPVRGALAATSAGRILATSEWGRVYAVSSAGCVGTSARREPLILGPVIDLDGFVYAAAGTSVRRLKLDQFDVPDDDPAFVATTLPWPVVAPLAANVSLIVPTAFGSEGRIYEVMPTALEPQQLATTTAPSGGVAMLHDTTILVPEQGETLSRWPSTGSEWHSPNLGGVARTPLVLEDARTPFAVSTDAGNVHALRPDGSIAWSGQFGTAALQPGNIYTPPGQPPDAVLSVAYFAGADGVLHAVIVDGALDGNAPWPKAFHDARNTNRAGAQP